MKLQTISKKQLEKMYGYSGDTENQVLKNGDVGYCEEENTIVVCCDNCGDYRHLVNIEIN